jgi:prephenate dehydrogenase
MRPRTLGIVGLGAVGGSVAWRAARAGVPRIVGYSVPAGDGVAAARAGALTELATGVRPIMRTAELVVLATPPAVTLQLLRRFAATIVERRVFVTDVTSVKAPIAALAASLGLAPWFAGSHPLVSPRGRGFDAASPELLRDAVVYVTPSGPVEEAVREIADFWEAVVGASPVRTDAPAHDAVTGWTTHLPHVVAAALAGALARHGPKGVTYAASAGETTRAALDGIERWRDVLLLNRNAVLGAIDGLDDQLDRLRTALRDGDAQAVTRWLDEGARWRGRLGR